MLKRASRFARTTPTACLALLLTAPTLAGPPDTDSDGIPDDTDNCPLVANPTQEDCNADGVGDACESDCDSDGIADKCEIESQIAKLIASNAPGSGRFGVSVALSDDTALVGAEFGQPAGMGSTGSAYVFVRTGGVWTQQQELTASDAALSDQFGVSVAVSGDVAVVGSFRDDHAGRVDAGSAYVFTRTGGVWTQQQKLTASDAAASDQFGGSVAVSGDTVVVGANGDDHAGGADAGSAYVFTRAGGVWTQHQKLIASDAAAVDVFGYPVALSGDTVVVGAHLDDHAGGTSAGSAYVFTRTGGLWTEQQKLTASDAAPYDHFGASVALSGDTAVIGAYDDGNSGIVLDGYGSAYVFTRTGGVWTQQQKLTASDAAASDWFGISVALSGDTAVVGAYADNHAGGADAGSAYVFSRTGGLWTEQQKLTASDAAANDRFGVSVSLSDDAAMVGAYHDDHAGGFDAGSAYVFGFADCDADGTPDVCEEDLDSDGVLDDCDNCPTVANPGQEDCNSDDTGDACSPDTDSDGVVDICDNCPTVVNPGQADCNSDGTGDACETDTDADGLEDDCDNCDFVANPGQEDCNSDGTGDACETDTDGDGLEDDCDNCDFVANLGQEDCNSDGTGDACETDTDADGVEDDCDNCPTVINLGQEDCDSDGTGDACDTEGDSDYDGLLDNCDNCISVPNLGQEDSDNDGLGDACDNCPYSSAECDPPQPDPISFASPPALLGSTSITMTATTATDATPPVRYVFQCTSASPGGTSSNGQLSVSYTDTGLSANMPYSYRVAARDSVTPTANQTAFSPEVNVSTLIEAPLGLATGVVGLDFIELVAQGTFSNLYEGQSGLYFDSLTPGGDTGLNVWVQGTTATATGLTPDTEYEFVVKARNRDGVETAFCDPITVHTYWVAGDCNNDGAFTVESDLDCIVEALLGNETSPPGGAHRIDLNYNEITDGEDIQFIVDCLQFGGC